MARKKIKRGRQSSRVDLSTVQGLRDYASTMGLEREAEDILDTTPKLSPLQRLTKGLGSFNPAEAILTGKEEGLGAGILKYGSGIVKGVGSAITGTDYEGERRYFKDVAEEMGIENGIAKFGLGFVGDVLLDPTTYFGGAIVKGIGLTAKTTTKLGLKGIGKISPQAQTSFIQAGENVADAFGSLFKAGYKSSEGLMDDVLSIVGRVEKSKVGLAQSNLARLGTQVLSPEQNKEIFARLAGGKRLEFALREKGVDVFEAGTKAMTKSLEGAEGIVKTTIEKQAERVAKFGQEVSGDEFYRSYFPFIKKDKLNKFLNETRKLQVGSEGYKKQFKNLLTDENIETNIAKAFWTREGQVVSDRIIRDGLNKIVKQHGKELTAFKSVDEATNAGYRLLKEKGIYGKEIGYISEWDYKFIEDMFSPEFKSIDMLAKATGFDAVTSLFKRSVTGLFPPFHIRNYVSGLLQNFETLGVASLDPRNIASGQKLALAAIGKTTLKKGDKMYRAFEPFTNRFGYSTFFKNEFDNAIKAGTDWESYGKAFTKPSFVKGIKTLGMSAESPHFRISRSIGNYIELQQKGTAYATALSQGKSIKEALILAETAGFDYRVLTKFESQIMRRIVPFYSFTRKNITLQLKTLGENPQRINQVIRLVSNLGEKASPEETEGLPDYVNEGFAIKIPDSVEGFTRLITSFGTPIEEFSSLFNKGTMMNIISRTNPLLKAPIEIGIGKDSFRDKDLKDVYNAKEYQGAPQFVKKFLELKEVKRPILKKVGDEYVKTGEYTQYVSNPEKLLVLRSLFTSRGFTYIDQIFNSDLEGFWKYSKLFTGMKPQEFNIELGRALKERDQKRALEDMLLKYTDIKKFETIYKPKQ